MYYQNNFLSLVKFFRSFRGCPPDRRAGAPEQLATEQSEGLPLEQPRSQKKTDSLAVFIVFFSITDRNPQAQRQESLKALLRTFSDLLSLHVIRDNP